MKKQILLASFLLCSTAAFSSEKQEQPASEQQAQSEQAKNSQAQIITALVQQNEQLSSQLQNANQTQTFKVISIFIAGAIAGAIATGFLDRILAYNIWNKALNEMHRV